MTLVIVCVLNLVYRVAFHCLPVRS